MDEEKIKNIYNVLSTINVTSENEEIVDDIKSDLLNENYMEAMKKLEKLNRIQKKNAAEKEKQKNEEEEIGAYPKKLSDIQLEETFVGLLLNDPKLIVKYYFLYDECYFENEDMLNIYKSILFTEGSAYTPEVAKEGFNFSRDSERVYMLKNQLKEKVAKKNYNVEKIYLDLKKLFVLRKTYLAIPIKATQDRIVEIKDYILYDRMSEQEVKDAVIQVNDTEKFKRAVLNQGLTGFLEMGENNLRNGLALPFPTLTSVFKGIRKGETMAFAMPSNAGKSRFTTDIAAHVALVHKKKVLVISNEMSEEKMRLCLITTILNNKEIQKMHGHNLHITEGELLEFKFRPDNKKDVEVDEDGYILRKKGEKQGDFVKRLLQHK